MNGVYKITNTATGDCYIGSSRRVEERIKEHKRCLKGNRHNNRFLQNAYLQHGSDSLVFEILLRCDAEMLLYYEQLFMNYYNPSYNIEKIAGNSRGTKRTEEVKRKLSEAHKGERNSFFGKRHTDETKQKIADSHKGKGAKDFGKLVSPTGEIFSVYNLNKFCREHNIDNISSVYRMINHPDKLKQVKGWRVCQ